MNLKAPSAPSCPADNDLPELRDVRDVTAAAVPDEPPEAALQRALDGLRPLLHRALAWRMATTRQDPRELVLVLRDGDLHFVPRADLSSHLPALSVPPGHGHIWLLFVRSQDQGVGLLRQVPIDLSQLTVKRPPSLPQEQ